MISRLYIYETENKTPYRNLAVEEYLTLHTGEQECMLYLWQNQHTVVVGKNQNCRKECAVHLLEEEGGCLVRRLSGGGAVYHDLGNLNFTFCVNKENYDLSRQLEVILEALKSLGLPAEKTGRNDVTLQGRKISGNAFYKSGNFWYHHGTLLVNADKEKMTRYLTVSKDKLRAKGVDSVRSRVANLKEFREDITVDILKKALVEAFSKVYGLSVEPLPLGRLDEAEILKKEERFKSWEWTWGRDIPFQHTMERRFSWGGLELFFDVSQGKIRYVKAFSDGMETELFEKAAQTLEGCRYEKESLTEALEELLTKEKESWEEEQELKEEILKDMEGMLREEL